MVIQRFSVIIMNDRTSVRPHKMIENIKNQNDLHLIGVAESASQVRELTSVEQVDIVIFAGYQKNEENYEVIGALAVNGQKPVAVIWAILDEFIEITCNEHGIRFQFDRQRPDYEFFDYLRIIARNHL